MLLCQTLGHWLWAQAEREGAEWAGSSLLEQVGGGKGVSVRLGPARGLGRAAESGRSLFLPYPPPLTCSGAKVIDLRMVEGGRILKAHLPPPPCCGQGHRSTGIASSLAQHGAAGGLGWRRGGRCPSAVAGATQGALLSQDSSQEDFPSLCTL